ncbi:cytochrome C oxidase subunit IV family protein [Deferribacter thermophilus]|uniref:cytochrome C oxidase subunit IV family protein n=1 Tax=Deferribacter thermophilus TaxID=53573 RepID=UPI003C24EF08
MSGEKHTVSYKVFTLVWIFLLILTAITVLVAQIDLGFFNVIAALTVATTKALLVILFFMHLKYENKLFKISVFIAFLILAIFIGFTFFDVAYR